MVVKVLWPKHQKRVEDSEGALLHKLEHDNIIKTIKTYGPGWGKHGTWAAFEGCEYEATKDETKAAVETAKKKLSHPGGSLHFIILEHLEGAQEVFDWVEKRAKKGDAFGGKEDLRLVVKIFQAVEYMHEQGIAHRDLKTENILISNLEAPEVKLIDFGFAVKGWPSTTELDVECTKFYCAPEVLKGDEINYDLKSADIYTLGVLAYNMVTGCEAGGKARKKIYDIDEKRWRETSKEKRDLLIQAVEDEKIPDCPRSSLLQDSDLQRLHALFKSMMNIVPTKRPTIEKALETLNETLTGLNTSEAVASASSSHEDSSTGA